MVAPNARTPRRIASALAASHVPLRAFDPPVSSTPGACLDSKRRRRHPAPRRTPMRRNEVMKRVQHPRRSHAEKRVARFFYRLGILVFLGAAASTHAFEAAADDRSSPPVVVSTATDAAKSKAT